MIEIRVPTSKSLTQRALLLAALSSQPCRLQNPLDCDDSKNMVYGLRRLGAVVDQRNDIWSVLAPAQLQAPSEPLVLGNSGTAVRFLAGIAPLVSGSYSIDGDQAMRRRPMGGLLGALRSLGVAVKELGRPGCPPVRLTPSGASAPEQITLASPSSSQELSALLMMGSRMPSGLSVKVEGSLPSRSYVDMTLAVLADFGVPAEETCEKEFRVSPASPRTEEYQVEGDWTSASYVQAAAWLTGKRVRLLNLTTGSVQGDRVFPDILRHLETPGPRKLDLGDTPDLVPTVVACALFAKGATEVRNVSHLRIKESDRISGLSSELPKLGADVSALPDGLVIQPGSLHGPAVLDSANDHRLAMAFGLVSLRVPGVEIRYRDCVSKSYPAFWDMLEAFR